MNSELRRLLRKEMEKKNLSIGEIARRLKKPRSQVSRMLSDCSTSSGKGVVPRAWQQLFDELGVTITLRPLTEEEKKERESQPDGCDSHSQ